MANAEHLEILKQSVKGWNDWRDQNPKIQPDLCDVNLSGMDLRGVDLYDAKLSRANLSGANLTKAFLPQVELLGANLSKTRLVGADLRFSLIYRTLFNGADLTNAWLNGVNFQDVDFSGAKLHKSRLEHTTFSDVDLSGVLGLDTVFHSGPSTIGIDTIINSKGNIPEVFLRGCGVPDGFITYMDSLVHKPIEYYSCFISYSSKDTEFAERLHADLQNKGVRCWFAPEDIKIGDKFRQRIDESIRLHDKLLLILSKNSINSSWVEDEVESALERERRDKGLVLFPVRIDSSIEDTNQGWAASLRRTRHIADFSQWKHHDHYKNGFARLVRDLKA